MLDNNHRWCVQFVTTYSWFESFADHHNPVDIAFSGETYDAQPTQYTMMSHHLDELDNPIDVKNRATALLALLDGAFYLQDGNFGGFKTEQIIDLTNGKRHGYADGNVLFEPFSAKWKSARVPRSYGDLRKSTARMIYMSRDDEVTRGMLMFLGVNRPGWISLYALRDYMNHGGWDDTAIGIAAGVSKKEVGRFRQTANNPAAVGPFARHGEQDHNPPTTVMTLEEAKKIIFTAAAKFLDERARQLGIVESYGRMLA